MNCGLIILLTFTTNAFANTKLVSQTVGFSGDRVVTSREVQMAVVVDSILSPAPEEKSVKIKEIQSDDPAMAGFTSGYLLDLAIAQEAESFSVGHFEESEFKSALQKVSSSVEGHLFWQKLEVSDVELKRVVQTKLTSRHFVLAKTGSLAGIITDQEAQVYFDKNRTKFGALPFSSFKENIKNYLAREQLKDRLSAWFDVIKKKYKVRNLLAAREKQKTS